MQPASRLFVGLLFIQAFMGLATADSLPRRHRDRRSFGKVHHARDADAIRALQWSSHKERALNSHGALAPRAGPSALPAANTPNDPLVPPAPTIPTCTLGQSLVGATCVPCVDQGLVPGATAGACLPPSMNLAVTPGTVNVFTYAVDNLPAGGSYRVVVTDSSPSARLGKRAGQVVFDTGAQPVTNSKSKGSFTHSSTPTTQLTVTVSSNPSGASVESFTSAPVPSCPAGSTYSTTTSACQVTDPAAAANCATGTVYDAVDKICKPIAAPITCPTGATVSGTGCLCAVGVYNPTTKVCDPAPTTCPASSTTSGATCICPTGQTYTAATNLCTPDPITPLSCAAGSMPNAAATSCTTCASLLRNAGSTAGTCGGCIAAFATLSTEGTCPCDAGYVLNSVTKACDSCAALGRAPGAGTCGACLDTTKTIGTGGICVAPPLSCTVANQVAVAGACTCDVGYILVGAACSTCTSLGKASGTTANTCLSCTNPLASSSSPTSACTVPTVVCPPGQAPNAAGTACDPCPVNTFSLAGASCTACPTGTIAAAGSMLASDCLGCPVGSYLNAGACSICEANTFSATPSATSCQACPAGSISPAGAIACTPCPAGTYVNAGVCTPCAVDTFSTVGATVCQACPAGSTSLAGASSCSTCAAGSAFQGGLCLPCAPGTYSTAAGSTSCLTCAAGTSSLVGETACTACTGNTASVAGGTCIECVNKLANADHSLCLSCPRGSSFRSQTLTCQCSNSRAYDAVTNTCAACATVGLPEITSPFASSCPLACNQFSTLANGACQCTDNRVYNVNARYCPECSTVNLPSGPTPATCFKACLPGSTLANYKCTCTNPRLGYTYWPTETTGEGCRPMLKNAGFEDGMDSWVGTGLAFTSGSSRKAGLLAMVLGYNGGAESSACQNFYLDGGITYTSGQTLLSVWGTWTGTRPSSAYFSLERLVDAINPALPYPIPNSQTFTDADQGSFKFVTMDYYDATGIVPGSKAMYRFCVKATVPNSGSSVFFDQIGVNQTG